VTRLRISSPKDANRNRSPDLSDSTSRNLPIDFSARGIPEFRLPRDVVREEVEAIVQSGVDVHLGEHVDRERLAHMADQYDAVLVAAGAIRGIEVGTLVKNAIPVRDVNGTEPPPEPATEPSSWCPARARACRKPARCRSTSRRVGRQNHIRDAP